MEEGNFFDQIKAFISGEQAAEIKVTASLDRASLLYFLVGILILGVILILFSIMLSKLFKV